MNLVIRHDLVPVLRLVKLLVDRKGYKPCEAYSLIDNQVFDLKLNVYDISGNAFAKQITDFKNGYQVIHGLWVSKIWLNTCSETEILPEHGVAPCDLALLKTDAETAFEFNAWVFDLPTKQSEEKSNQPAEAKNAETWMSEKLKILNQTAYEFWHDADPDDETTHPKNEEVENWLKGKGYSDIGAAQGATIIRPLWGKIGRPKKTGTPI